MMHRFSNLKRQMFGFALLATGLLVTGCDSDSNGDDGNNGELTVSGRVTDNAGYASKAADIEGATVVAYEMNAQGSLVQGEGQATTTASGQYALETDVDSDIFVVVATKGTTFNGRTLVQNENDDNVSAMTINDETSAEAHVFVKAYQQQRQSSSSRGTITPADVAFYVDSDVAAEINSGAASDDNTAIAIRAAVNAEARSLDEDGVSDDDLNDYNERRRQAFIRLQSDLVASTDSEDEEIAINRLNNTMAEAAMEAGFDARTSARARLAAAAALMAFSDDLSGDARLHLRKRIEILAATSISMALVDEFENESELEGSADDVESAGVSLRAAINASDSEEEIEEAWEDFQTSVNAELSTALSIDGALLLLIDTTLEPFRIAYESDLSAATSAEDVVEARADFSTNVESSVETILSDMANAETSARIWALATVH